MEDSYLFGSRTLKSNDNIHVAYNTICLTHIFDRYIDRQIHKTIVLKSCGFLIMTERYPAERTTGPK